MIDGSDHICRGIQYAQPILRIGLRQRHRAVHHVEDELATRLLFRIDTWLSRGRLRLARGFRR